MRKRNGITALVMFFLAYWVLFPGHPLARSAPPGHQKIVMEAIAWAKSREGCPYTYGGTGPCSAGYDCSGLVQDAFAAAGVSVPRTSEEQWSAGPQVSTPQPGDLVFFTGSPIDPPPGHVGIVLGKNTLIDAYGAGTPVRVESFGLSSSASGLQDPTGYTDPG